MADNSDEQHALRRFIRKRRALLLAQAFLAGSCAVGMFNSADSPLWLSIAFLGLCLWLLWRTARYPLDLYNAWVESERERWKALAAPPVARCPTCFWVSYNGNATHCAECGAELVRIPE